MYIYRMNLHSNTVHKAVFFSSQLRIKEGQTSAVGYFIQ